MTSWHDAATEKPCIEWRLVQRLGTCRIEAAVAPSSAINEWAHTLAKLPIRQWCRRSPMAVAWGISEFVSGLRSCWFPGVDQRENPRGARSRVGQALGQGRTSCPLHPAGRRFRWHKGIFTGHICGIPDTTSSAHRTPHHCWQHASQGHLGSTFLLAGRAPWWHPMAICVFAGARALSMSSLHEDSWWPQSFQRALCPAIGTVRNMGRFTGFRAGWHAG